MIRLLLSLLVAISLALPAQAQQRARMDRNVERQRAAVEAWTTCIADEQEETARRLLAMDFRTDEYRDGLNELAKTRVSEKCFSAMPRAYRRIELGGLPFAGGLAERLIEQGETPLLTRLNYAAAGTEATTYGRSDAMAMCMVRGAPHLVAVLFDTKINAPEELQAIAALMPIADACLPQGQGLEGSPLGLRSILATAAFRLLAAHDGEGAS